MTKTPTIYEVARTAGVSPATVSRYLRGNAVRAWYAVESP
ncbi:MAG: LacI family DNA-binding transcriptional regulator [Actinomycetota bacterium]